MITLQNLKKVGNVIEADYVLGCYPDRTGHFKYDIVKGDYIEIDHVSEGIEYGFSHIKQDLQRLIAANIFPQTRHIFWY